MSCSFFFSLFLTSMCLYAVSVLRCSLNGVLLRLGGPLISPVLNQLRADVHAEGRDTGQNMLSHTSWGNMGNVVPDAGVFFSSYVLPKGPVCKTWRHLLA